ncbi:MAG TPA: nucleotidyltransferase domain-containing protein [Actinoplanes sp.]|jgi:hypothetical protein
MTTYEIPKPGLPGEALLIGVVGSMASGLNRPGSDVDRAGVYAAPTVAFGWMGDPPRDSVTWMAPDPDLCVYEAGKYAGMVLGCNPAAVELLWLPEYDVLHPLAAELVKHRAALLCAEHVRLAYIGAARSLLSSLVPNPGPLTRMARPEVRRKTARKMLYLLWQGLGLYCTGELPVRVDDPDVFHDFGERCAGPGQWRHAEEMLHRYTSDFAAAKSPLPPGSKPARAFMHSWVAEVRDTFTPDAGLRERLEELAGRWAGQHRDNAGAFAEELRTLLEETR